MKMNMEMYNNYDHDCMIEIDVTTVTYVFMGSDILNRIKSFSQD